MLPVSPSQPSTRDLTQLPLLHIQSLPRSPSSLPYSVHLCETPRSEWTLPGARVMIAAAQFSQFFLIVPSINPTDDTVFQDRILHP